MVIDENKLESRDKNVNLLSKNTYNISKICGYCALSLTILLGKRGRVQLQGQVIYGISLKY